MSKATITSSTIPVFSNASIDQFGSDNKSETIRTDLPVHIRVQQRRGKKCLTLVEGLALDLDLKKISKALRHTHNTSVSIVRDDDDREILQLAGDLRKEVRNFLLMTHICGEDQVKIHGY